MPEPIRLRPAEPDDESFLIAVYITTRQAEVAALPWSDEQEDAFLRSQADAQHRHYREQFPDADFLVIEREGVPIGRYYLGRSTTEIRLIDIALLPDHRGSGIGSQLLAELLVEACAARLPVRLHVEPFNPALRLYERLGFRQVEDRGVHLFMEWTPPAD